MPPRAKGYEPGTARREVPSYATLESRVRAALVARRRSESWVSERLPADADWAPWSGPWIAAAAALLEVEPEAPAERPSPLPGGGGLYAAPLAEVAPDRVIELSVADMAAVLADRRAS
jgi:hypothetical protein